MTHKTFSVFDAPTSTWQSAWQTMAQASFALNMLQDDESIAPLARHARAALDEWNSLEASRLQLRAASVATRAMVRVADVGLDHCIEKIAGALIATGVAQGTDAYRAYFPEDHQHIIALGLDAELPSATLLLSKLAETDVPPSLKDLEDDLRVSLQAGNSALMSRSEVYVELGKLQARIDAWIESAAALRVNLTSRLRTVAMERELPARWVTALMGE